MLFLALWNSYSESTSRRFTIDMTFVLHFWLIFFYYSNLILTSFYRGYESFGEFIFVFVWLIMFCVLDSFFCWLFGCCYLLKNSLSYYFNWVFLKVEIGRDGPFIFRGELIVLFYLNSESYISSYKKN